VLIVGYRSSKISFHFCNNCRIFCEGVKEQINNGNAIVKQRQISLDDLISLVGLIGLSGISGLVGRISLVGCIGLNGIIGLSASSACWLIGLGYISLIGFGGFSGINDFSLISLVSLIGLIGLIGLISLVGLSASSAHQLIDLDSRAILSAHCQPHNLVVAIIAAACKQAAHGVATMLTSTNKIASMATLYFCAASLLHTSVNDQILHHEGM
jgi:hypothetical protein